MLEVRTAKKPEIPKSVVVFLYALLWGIFSVAIFMELDNKLLGISLISIGLPIFIYLIYKERKNQSDWLKMEAEKIKSMLIFRCQACSKEIDSSVKNQGVTGEPILYYCNDCEILWFVGSVVDSD
jgi:hypothetical protein